MVVHEFLNTREEKLQLWKQGVQVQVLLFLSLSLSLSVSLCLSVCVSLSPCLSLSFSLSLSPSLSLPLSIVLTIRLSETELCTSILTLKTKCKFQM